MKRILSIIAAVLILSSVSLAAGLPRYEIGDVGTNESQAAVIVGNRVAITGAGSKIISFMSGKATGEVAYIDKDGNLSLNGAISTTGTMSAGTLNVTTLNATTAAIATANITTASITNEVITGTSTIEVADITTAGITNLNVTGTATIAAADISSGVFSSVRSATFEGTSGGVIDGTLTLENSNTTGTATMASAYVSGTVIATSVEGVSASGIDIEANRIIRSDVQLTGSTADGFPNTTTTYIWNFDSAADGDQTDVVGSKVLTRAGANALTAAADVLGVIRYNTCGAETYLTSTDAVFDLGDTPDTDDVMFGGWIYTPSVVAGNNECVISNWTANANNPGYNLAIDIGNILHFSCYKCGTDVEFGYLKIPTGWVHVVAVREVGVGMYLYVNGVLVSTASDITFAGAMSSKFQISGINHSATAIVESGTRFDEIFFRKGVLPTNLPDVIRNIYARSAKKFAVKDQNSNVYAIDNNLLKLSSGFYAPAITNGTNIQGTTTHVARWHRIGDTVFVSGTIDIDVTGAGAFDLLITLPIASNLTNASDDLGGCAGSYGGAGCHSVIYGDTATDKASWLGWSVNTGNAYWGYTFSYTVK